MSHRFATIGWQAASKGVVGGLDPPVLCIPGSVLSLGAGFVFGLAFGSIVVWIGASSGAALAFLLGRFLLRDNVAKMMRRSPTWQGLDTALQEEGWKLMLLLRLSPIVPFSLLNYGLGITPVSFFSYVLTTSVGILPGAQPSLEWG
jgi:uncharacterized membrane protein YdjX (TVP38/TMEM64 family)